MRLQHRAKITGSFIGVEWQMWHLNMSLSCLNRPGGSFIPLLTDNMAERSLHISFISFSSSRSSFIFFGTWISSSLSLPTLITSFLFLPLLFQGNATTQPHLLHRSFCYLLSKTRGICVTWLDNEIIASLLLVQFYFYCMHAHANLGSLKNPLSSDHLQ